MACPDCSAARETAGAWRFFDPSCLWCGARLIQRIGALEIQPAQMNRRRRAVLADWMAMDHDEQELRTLAMAKDMAAEPQTKGLTDAPRRKN